MSQFKGKVLLIANTDYTPRAADGEVFFTCSYICNCGLCRRTSFGGACLGVISGKGMPPPVVALPGLGAEKLAGIPRDIRFIEHRLLSYQFLQDRVKVAGIAHH
ncbi:MAG: hypothetical protein II763_03625, partial [Bacteroidales bacterium]|nr:hypothetical protein [Bacteroidales bacterium]